MWLRRLTGALFASRAKTHSLSLSEDQALRSVAAASMRLIAFLDSWRSTGSERSSREISQLFDDLGGVAESLGQISISLETIQLVMSREEVVRLDLLQRPLDLQRRHPSNLGSTQGH